MPVDWWQQGWRASQSTGGREVSSALCPPPAAVSSLLPLALLPSLPAPLLLASISPLSLPLLSPPSLPPSFLTMNVFTNSHVWNVCSFPSLCWVPAQEGREGQSDIFVLEEPAGAVAICGRGTHRRVQAEVTSELGAGPGAEGTAFLGGCGWDSPAGIICPEVEARRCGHGCLQFLLGNGVLL